MTRILILLLTLMLPAGASAAPWPGQCPAGTLPSTTGCQNAATSLQSTDLMQGWQVQAGVGHSAAIQINQMLVAGFAAQFSGLGTTPLNASFLTSGTIPAARLPDLSTASATATGQTQARPIGDWFSDTIDVKGSNAKADAVNFIDAVVNNASCAVSSATGGFGLAAVGMAIEINGAGSGGITGAPLTTTILTKADSGHITVANCAGTATQRAYLTRTNTLTDVTAGSAQPGDLLNFVCGGCTVVATGYVNATQVRAAAVNAAGAGGTPGTCHLTGTTGTGTKATLTGTVGGGGTLSSINSVDGGGTYIVQPTTAADPVTTDCGLTGATLALTMGVYSIRPNNQGNYSLASATATLAQSGAAVPSGATGLVITPTWVNTGSGTFGTDNGTPFTQAFQAALDRTTNTAARVRIYIPGGNYYIASGTLPTLNTSIAVVGDGHVNSNLIMGAAYAGSELLGWQNTSTASVVEPYGGPIRIVTQSDFGGLVRDLGIYGNRSSAAVQHAITLYDRQRYFRADNLFINNIHGSCIRSGVTKSLTSAFFGEGELSFIRCFRSGSPGFASLDIASGGSGNQTPVNDLDLVAINIFGSYDKGLWIHDDQSGGNDAKHIKVSQIRVEGFGGDTQDVNADLIMIGNAAASGQTTRVFIAQAQLVDPPLGFAALRLTGSTRVLGVGEFSMKDMDISGGIPLGKGVVVEKAASNIRVEFSKIATLDTAVTVGNSTNVNGPVIFTGNGPSLLGQSDWAIDASIASQVAIQATTFGDPSLTSTFLANPQSTNFTAGLQLAGVTVATTSTPRQIITTCTVSCTFTKNALSKTIRWVAFSQGGCGGGGAMATAGNVATGGGGGGGGVRFDQTFLASDISSTTTVTIGTPCVGGVGATVNGDGAASTLAAGATISVGAKIQLLGGGAGGKGKATAASVGGGSAGIGGAGQAGDAGGAAGAAWIGSVGLGVTGTSGGTGSDTTGVLSLISGNGGGAGSSVTTGFRGGWGTWCPGGGSGGVILAGPTASVGGTGGGSLYAATLGGGGGAAGAIAGGAGGAGNGSNSPSMLGGGAPGGGGGNTAGAGGAAGVPTNPCVGGAGGGAGTASGANGSVGGQALFVAIESL